MANDPKKPKSRRLKLWALSDEVSSFDKKNVTEKPLEVVQQGYKADSRNRPFQWTVFETCAVLTTIFAAAGFGLTIGNALEDNHIQRLETAKQEVQSARTELSQLTAGHDDSLERQAKGLRKLFDDERQTLEQLHENQILSVQSRYDASSRARRECETKAVDMQKQVDFVSSAIRQNQLVYDSQSQTCSQNNRVIESLRAENNALRSENARLIKKASAIIEKPKGRLILSRALRVKIKSSILFNEVNQYVAFDRESTRLFVMLENTKHYISAGSTVNKVINSQNCSFYMQDISGYGDSTTLTILLQCW